MVQSCVDAATLDDDHASIALWGLCIPEMRGLTCLTTQIPSSQLRRDGNCTDLKLHLFFSEGGRSTGQRQLLPANPVSITDKSVVERDQRW
jgi:hypothetical protein